MTRFHRRLIEHFGATRGPAKYRLLTAFLRLRRLNRSLRDTVLHRHEHKRRVAFGRYRRRVNYP
jgi:hypothetical protein